jgi:DNA-binding XRE family transcriptional regulator
MSQRLPCGGPDRVPPADDAPVGALLRKWRERALLSQEQLAERAGVSARTIRSRPRQRAPRSSTNCHDLTSCCRSCMTVRPVAQSLMWSRNSG